MPTSRLTVSPAEPRPTASRSAVGSSLGLLIAAVFACLLASPGLSQSGSGGSDQVPPVEEQIYVRATARDVVTLSTVATKLPAEISELPVSVSVLPAGLLEETNPATVGDALTNAVGVSVQPNNNTFDLFIVRGLDSTTSGSVLIDGVQEPEASFYPTYNVDQIEVLRGPAASLYGGSPLAGAVGVVRKQPTTESIQLLRATGGSFGTFNLNFDFSSGGSDTLFRVNALARSTDGYRDGREGDTLAIHPSAQFTLGDFGVLRLSVEGVANEYTPDAGLPIFNGALVQVDPETSYQSPLDASEQDLVRGQIEVEGAVGSWNLRNRFYLRSLDWQSQGTILSGTFPFPPSFAPVTLRNLITLDNEQEVVGNQLEFSLDSDRSRFLVGAEVSRGSDDYQIDVGFLPPIDPFMPIEFLQGGIENVPFDPSLQQLGRTETDVEAIYAIERFDFGSRASLYVGGRFDSVSFEDSVTSTSRDDDEFSPLIGLNVSFSGNWSGFASYTSAFAPASSRVVGDRAPEESEQVEVGVRASFLSGRVFSSLVAYDLERTNIAIFDPNFLTAQQGVQASEGVEFDLTASFGDGWRLQFGAAYNDSEFEEFNEVVVFGPGPFDFFIADRSGNRPAFAPDWTGNLWLHRQLGRWSFGGGLTHRGDFAIAADNAYIADSVTLLEASVSYSWQHVRLFANGRNLTDEDYVGQGFGNTSAIPGDPASFLVGVELRR